jgi:hypothetical protein
MRGIGLEAISQLRDAFAAGVGHHPLAGDRATLDQWDATPFLWHFRHGKVDHACGRSRAPARLDRRRKSHERLLRVSPLDPEGDR